MSEMHVAGKLGFGLMRLPRMAEEHAEEAATNGQERIDIEQTKQMVDLFLEAGFSYFDTAWAYPGSEDAIRQALVERHPRESFQLATKNAAWINCPTRDDAIGQFETSLRQTGAGYFVSAQGVTVLSHFWALMVMHRLAQDHRVPTSCGALELAA